jgi:hypothetical protein
MPRHISSEKARANWREILDAVDGGEEIVIERYGHPVAVLSPYNAATRVGQLREAGPVYTAVNIEQLKAEIIAEVLAELSPPELLSWREGLAQLQASIAEHGGLNVGETTEEIVEHMRRVREEIFEAEYAHLYR